MNNSAIEKALSDFASKNNIDKSKLEMITTRIPEIKSKVMLLTEKEIEEIKSSVSQDKLNELEDILKSIK